MFLILQALLVVAHTFGAYGADAARTLSTAIYDGRGAWYLCERGCAASDRDWGADALTYTAYMRWRLHRDGSIVRIMRRLEWSAPVHSRCDGPACPWSDEPEWDAVAAARMYSVTGDGVALQKAEGDYEYVRASRAFALGACPRIPFQRPFGAGGGLKTLETGATAIKAALLLYGLTRRPAYLRDAIALYAAVRQYFPDRVVPLYSVYVFDDGKICRQLPHRFFASVNGEMIDNGLLLYVFTSGRRYLRDALATEEAVETKLADGAGVFADMQAENDIVEPLVEAMYELAVVAHRAPAKAWILRNARAALADDRDARGWYGRFFDGPAPDWNVTAWQTNGGLALAIAAAALDPNGVPESGAWRGARLVRSGITALPAAIRFTGKAIALIGSIGERCCEAGHAAVRIDGVRTFDETGIWQNKSSAGMPIRNAVLFAWRWKTVGTHTIRFEAAPYNAKEGGAFLRVQALELGAKNNNNSQYKNAEKYGSGGYERRALNAGKCGDAAARGDDVAAMVGKAEQRRHEAGDNENPQDKPRQREGARRGADGQERDEEERDHREFQQRKICFGVAKSRGGSGNGGVGREQPQ